MGAGFGLFSLPVQLGSTSKVAVSVAHKPQSRRTRAVTPTATSGGGVETQELYRFLVESVTGYAIFAVSVEGIVVSWNAGAEQTFGYGRRESGGKSFAVVFTPDDIALGGPLD